MVNKIINHLNWLGINLKDEITSNSIMELDSINPEDIKWLLNANSKKELVELAISHKDDILKPIEDDYSEESNEILFYTLSIFPELLKLDESVKHNFISSLQSKFEKTKIDSSTIIIGNNSFSFGITLNYDLLVVYYSLDKQIPQADKYILSRICDCFVGNFRGDNANLYDFEVSEANKVVSLDINNGSGLFRYRNSIFII